MHFAQLFVFERKHRRIFSVESNLDQWKRLHSGEVTLCIPPVSRRGEREEKKIEAKKTDMGTSRCGVKNVGYNRKMNQSFSKVVQFLLRSILTFSFGPSSILAV